MRRLVIVLAVILLLVGLGVLVPWILSYQANNDLIKLLSERMTGINVSAVRNAGTMGVGVFKQIQNNTIQVRSIVAADALIFNETGQVELEKLHMSESLTSAASKNNRTGLVLQVDSFGRVLNANKTAVARIFTLNTISQQNVVIQGESNITVTSVAANHSVIIATLDNVTATNMSVMNMTTLSNAPICETRPFDTASCVELSMQSCATPLQDSCWPNQLNFSCLTVMQTINASNLNFQVSNQTGLVANDMSITESISFNGPVLCNAPIDDSCYNISCSQPLAQSCFPDVQTLQSVTITDSLSLNSLQCNNGPLPSSCLSFSSLSSSAMCTLPLDLSCAPPAITTINGAFVRDFELQGAGLIQVTGTTISTTAEKNTAINVGNNSSSSSDSGHLFAQKNGSTLEFRSLLGGPGVNVTLGNSNLVNVELESLTPALAGNTFTAAAFTVDAYGRITDASSQAIPSSRTAANVGTGPVSVINSIVGPTLNVRTLNGINDLQTQLDNETVELLFSPPSTVAAGAYGSPTERAVLDVTSQGRVLSATTAPVTRRSGTVAFSAQQQTLTRITSTTTVPRVYVNTCPTCNTTKSYRVPISGVYFFAVLGSGGAWRASAPGVGSSFNDLCNDACVRHYVTYAQAGQSFSWNGGNSVGPNSWSIQIVLYSLF